MSGKLYLVPSFLYDGQAADSLPKETLDKVHTLKEFIVERSKTARAFLKAINIPTPQNELILHELDKHGKDDIDRFLKSASEGGNIGLLSEAGMPCVADPGAEVVARAHKKGIQVIPLVGASSILLALMASGFNGQSFAFHGYLPIQADDRKRKLLELEANAGRFKQTQIFIETPYRNNQMIDAIGRTCNNSTLLCVAANLTSPDEKIISTNVGEWKHMKYDFHKQPAVFIIYS